MQQTRRFRAPGRVNLIGEHTDYSGGFVMPMAIQLATTVSHTPRSDQLLVIRSEGFDATTTIDLAQPLCRTGSWSDYIAGVAKMLVGRWLVPARRRLADHQYRSTRRGAQLLGGTGSGRRVRAADGCRRHRSIARSWHDCANAPKTSSSAPDVESWINTSPAAPSPSMR